MKTTVMTVLCSLSVVFFSSCGTRAVSEGKANGHMVIYQHYGWFIAKEKKEPLPKIYYNTVIIN